MKYLIWILIALWATVAISGCDCSQTGYYIQDEHGNRRGDLTSSKEFLQNPNKVYWVCINNVLSYSNSNAELQQLYNQDGTLTKCEIMKKHKKVQNTSAQTLEQVD